MRNVCPTLQILNKLRKKKLHKNCMQYKIPLCERLLVEVGLFHSTFSIRILLLMDIEGDDSLLLDCNNCEAFYINIYYNSE